MFMYIESCLEFGLCVPRQVVVVCPGELPEYYVIYFESEQGECPAFKSEDLKITQSGHISRLDTTAYLGNDCVYTVIIEAKNGAGHVNSTGRKITIGRALISLCCRSTLYCGIFTIGTTPVLVDIQYSQERLNISCSFNHTLYRTCLVQVIESVTGFYDAVYAARAGGPR